MDCQVARSVVGALLAVTYLGGMVLACSSFGGSDSATNNPGAGGSDADVADGAVAGDAGAKDAATDTAPDTGLAVTDRDASDLLSDDVEGQQAGDTCAASVWTCSTCTTKVVRGISRSGKQSCMVCRSGQNSAVYFVTPIPGAGDYTLDAYVMSLPDAGVFSADAGEPYALAAGYAALKGMPLVYLPNNTTTLRPGEWSHAQSARTVAADSGADQLHGYIQVFPEVPADCFYVDDVRLYRR